MDLMLRKRLERQGMNHRRWRLALVFLLAPFAAYTFASSGWMTEQFGALAEQRWDLLCLCVAMIGLGIRLHMAGHGQAAEAGELVPTGELRRTGFYSVVRHPTSLANFLILLSGSLLFKSPLFTGLVAAVACLYYERLAMAKERLLLKRYGREFNVWAERTPFVIPKFSAWINPSTKFDVRAGVRREAVTFALIGVMFFTLETLEGTMIDGLPFWEWVNREPVWAALFVVSGTIFWTQLSRIWAIAVLVMTSVALGASQVGESVFSTTRSQEGALKALIAGGHVLLLRHASTTGKDRDDVEVTDCSTQRNLSEAGREQALAIGRMLRDRGIKIGKAISSQYCRTKETAQLMGAEAIETMSNLNERSIHVTLIEQVFGNSEKDEKILGPIRAIIKDWKGQGNLLLVSHAPIIRNLTHDRLNMGEGLVLLPNPKRSVGFTIVGKIPRSALKQ
jgi:protein-S-isoprenylcysteine O-methyltransferase Ste14/broad specificity phosphatase PhoE